MHKRSVMLDAETVPRTIDLHPEHDRGEDRHESVLDRTLIDSKTQTLDPNSILIYISYGSAHRLDGLPYSTDKRSLRVQTSGPHIIRPTRRPAQQPPTFHWQAVRSIRYAHVVASPRGIHLERLACGRHPYTRTVPVCPVADYVSSTGTPVLRNRRDLSAVAASAVEPGVVDRCGVLITESGRADLDQCPTRQ